MKNHKHILSHSFSSVCCSCLQATTDFMFSCRKFSKNTKTNIDAKRKSVFEHEHRNFECWVEKTAVVCLVWLHVGTNAHFFRTFVEFRATQPEKKKKSTYKFLIEIDSFFILFGFNRAWVKGCALKCAKRLHVTSSTIDWLYFTISCVRFEMNIV